MRQYGVRDPVAMMNQLLSLNSAKMGSSRAKSSRVDVVGSTQLGQRVDTNMRVHIKDTRRQPSAVRLNDFGSLRRREVPAQRDEETSVEENIVREEKLVSVVLARPDCSIADESRRSRLLA